MSPFSLFLLIHLIGFAIGMGGASIADLLFIRGLRRRHFSGDHVAALLLIGQLVWAGWFLLVGSGIGMIGAMFLVKSTYVIPAAIWAKAIIAAIIGLNGLFMHRQIIPKLKFAANEPLEETAFAQHIGAAITSGALSVTSWASVFLISTTRSIDLSLGEYLGLYVLALIAALIIGQITVRFYQKHLALAK